MSGTSSGASSRSGGARSNAGERSVRRAEYAVHREAVNDWLDAIEAGAAENGGRSKRLRTVPPRMGGGSERLRTCSGTSRMCWIQANQDADKLNSEQGQHNGAASARGSTSDKLWLKERITVRQISYG